MRIFLAAHGAGFARVRVEQHRGLLNRTPFLDFIDLPLHFKIYRLLHEAEGIEVLDFAPCAEFLLPDRAHRHVGVTAERAFLHVAVANADPLHQCVQGLGIGNRFGGGAHVGFGNDFQERCAGAVQVDAGLALEIFMQGFAGVFFQMRARELDVFFLLANADSQSATGNDRNFKLADLVALGQVGVEVILARKNRAWRNLPANGQAKFDGADHGFTVEHRQHTGQGNIDGARLRIRRRAKGDAAAGKDFRLRFKLGVRFQSDDDFPLCITHARPPGIRVCQSVTCWY